jgi:hypothetical protein
MLTESHKDQKTKRTYDYNVPYDFMIWHECAYPTKNRQYLHTTPTHYTYIPRPISLCFYYYLKHLLSLFNSFIYIYKYRSRREGVGGEGGRREGERVKS